MRIIGGKYRGKKLISPVSKNIRPTSDKAREAIFNILRNKFGGNFYGRKLIDVFAGSGAFGLEALSQGFSEIALVDIDYHKLLFYSWNSASRIAKTYIATHMRKSPVLSILISNKIYNKLIFSLSYF